MEDRILNMAGSLEDRGLNDDARERARDTFLWRCHGPFQAACAISKDIWHHRANRCVEPAGFDPWSRLAGSVQSVQPDVRFPALA